MTIPMILFRARRRTAWSVPSAHFRSPVLARGGGSCPREFRDRHWPRDHLRPAPMDHVGRRRDKFTPNRIADRMSRTTEASRSDRRPERSRNAPRMRADDIRPHRPLIRGVPVVAAASFAPSSFAFTSARNLRFTDPAMMYRETIDNGDPRGRGGGPRWCAMGRISVRRRDSRGDEKNSA